MGMYNKSSGASQVSHKQVADQNTGSKYQAENQEEVHPWFTLFVIHIICDIDWGAFG